MPCLFILAVFSVSAQSYNTAKPWTYWWWMGSAATPEDITWQMERFAAKGLGGVHIIPIYGVKGFEKQFIPFLSREWTDVLQHTIREGKRLGLGVDMTTGTGWPFGGPNVTPETAAGKWKAENGEIVTDLTGQQVKRAAPGGEGLVLDPFGKGNMEQYLQRFDSAFAGLPLLPRSMYNDSYEVYGANWTRDFEEEFKSRRGYEFGKAAKILSGDSDAGEKALARIDYLQTLAELLRDNYTRPWVKWSREKGMKTRLQAHGSPANILDLYAEADIPETESFGTSQFSIPGLRVDPDFEEDRFGRPNPLAMKMASSPAHLTGKKLVSSETTTWLANHFKVSMSQIKPQLDELFVSGINHIFYHGTTYTPKDEPFPGWLFYASTNYGPHSHFEKHFHLLNSYITRIQAYLQASAPRNDILLYFPIHDLWAAPAKRPEDIQMLDVHHTEKWLAKLPFGRLAESLWKEGYTFDYVSDRQLTSLKGAADGQADSGHGRYKIILVPESVHMPESTLEELKRLALAGMKIVFEGSLPRKATGLEDNERRSALLSKEAGALVKQKNVFFSGDWRKDLSDAGVAPEMIADKGLSFIRKEYEGQPFYFVANLSDRFKTGWVRLNHFQRGATAMNTLTGFSKILPARGQGDGREFLLELLPGESVMLLGNDDTRRRSDVMSGGQDKIFGLKGEWMLDFKEGKPSFSKVAFMDELQSWTTVPDSGEYFSGTVAYTLSFDLPDHVPVMEESILDLGDVREVAEVSLNGRPVIGTAWCIPFRLALPPGALRKGKNTIRIEVTNLSANYMRLLDEKNPGWKKFYDINIVDITYKPFKASRWAPMPSGLLEAPRLYHY